MAIYIDNGKTVKEYCTDNKTEKAISVLLEQIEDMMFSETIEGCCVVIKDKNDM